MTRIEASPKGVAFAPTRLRLAASLGSPLRRVLSCIASVFVPPHAVLSLPGLLRHSFEPCHFFSIYVYLEALEQRYIGPPM